MVRFINNPLLLTSKGFMESSPQKHGIVESIKSFYEKKYKLLLILPILLLVASLVQIGYQTATTGSFILQDVSLKGGLTVTVHRSADVAALQQQLIQEFPNGDISVRTLSQTGTSVGAIIEASSDIDSGKLVESLNSKFDNLSKDEYSVELIGGSLGKSFFKETIIALLFSFFFMALVIFAYFRTFVPSFAVVLAVFSDMIMTIATLNILGIEFGTAGIAALLMLIGYSVDSDIILSTRVLRRKPGDSITESIYGAMKTGMMMTATAIVALLVALIFGQEETIKQIMVILLVGLFYDIFNTWIQNVAILRMYLDKKHGKQD